ncbi:hypothetical protein NKI56_25240 [Mesorhizobium sp. M0622]|uniref:hypothetical protein n=1 Tax=unclassified Mesorhizobium TaxID=325217 RepID=UPI00333CAB56
MNLCPIDEDPKGVADGGHLDQLQEVDALVGLAKEMADRQLRRAFYPVVEIDGSMQDRDEAKD